MSKDDDGKRSGVAPSVLRWLERLLVALGGVLVGAVGSEKLAENPLGVTVAVPASASPATPGKVCPAAPAPNCAKSVVGIATFVNGGSALTESSKESVQRWARALSRCDGVQLQLVGSTSSIPFRPEPLRNNVWLANERANSVASYFRDEGVRSIEILKVSREEDLESLRLVNDRHEGRTDERLAAVARRVDLNIRSLGSCELGNQPP